MIKALKRIGNGGKLWAFVTLAISVIYVYTQAIRVIRNSSGWSSINKKEVFTFAYYLN